MDEMTYDAQRLKEQLARCSEVLVQLKIPISRNIFPEIKLNSRAKKRLGCCIKKDGSYIIELSTRLLTDRQDLLSETLYHEILHTCPGCGNHGERWKSYAAVVNRALGLKISRTAKLESEEQPDPKYILKCRSCGIEIARFKLSKVVKSPGRYRCGKCGGSLERIK